MLRFLSGRFAHHPLGQNVDDDRGENNQPLDGGLPELRNPDERKRLLDDRHGQRAQQNAHDAALPAVEAYAADDARRDDVHLHTHAHVALRAGIERAV